MIKLSDKIDHKLRPQFISRSGLLLILLTAIIISWLVYPRSLFFERNQGDKVSRLSLSYLKVLLSRAPQNADLRLKLADQQMRFWQFDKAWQTIEPLVKSDNQKAHYLALKIRFQQLIGTDQETDEYHALNQSVMKMLSKLLTSEFADIEVANIAAAMGLHIQAAKLFHALSLTNTDTGLLHLAGRQYLAANDPNSATKVYYRLYQQSPSLDKIYSWARAALSYKVNLSQLQWYLAASPEEPGLIYWELAGQLALAASVPDQYVIAREKIYAISATKPNRDQLVNAYMGQSELLNALPLVKLQLADDSNDPDIHRRIRDLYLWLGQPAPYLKEVLWLAEHSPRAEDFAQAAPLAIGQFYFSEATWLYQKLAGLRALSTAELTNWFESHYQAGTAEQGAIALRNYMDEYGPSAHLVALLALVANDLGNYQQLLSDWTLYGRFFQLPPSIYQLYSGANWQRGEFTQALQVLDNVPVDDRSIEYWKLYGDLAWLGEQAEVAIDAYQSHLALDSQAEGERIARLEVLLARYQPEAYFKLLIHHFEKHGVPRYLLLASDILIERGDVTQLNTLMTLGEQNGALDKLPVLRTYQSWLFQQQGKFAESVTALQKAYTALPDDLNIQLALLWALLAHGDEQTLSTLVSKLANQVATKAQFWQPMALSYERLKQPKKAIPWYQLALKEQPSNYQMMFNYAEALKASGYQVTSYRVKQYLLTKLTEQADEFGMLPAFLQLVLWNEFEGLAASLNQDILYQSGNENLLLSYLVQGNYQFAAQQYYQAFQTKNVKIQDSLELRFALARGDKERLKDLIAKGIGLPSADRVSALVMLEREREAVRWADLHLSNALTDNEQSQLRHRLVSIKPKYAHFAQLSFDNSSAYQQDNFSFRYGIPLGENQQWQTEIVSDHFGDVLLPSGANFALTQQLSWKNQWQWFSYQDDYSLKTDISWGDDWRRDGLALSWERRWQPSFSTKGYWEINQSTSASQLANALAQSDILGISSNWLATGRESVSLDIKSLRYDSHYGDNLGKGKAITLTLTEQVFYKDPTWKLYFSWQWQRNHIVDGAIEGVANAFDGVSVTAADFITPIYGRLSVGSRIYRGQPGTIVLDMPSPRFFLDANVGYVYLDGRTDFGISSGVGWRLFGADELSFSGQYQSSNLQQNSDFKLKLNYQIHFD
jgi:thioredoxin-like negative regulator of GroEL